MGGDQRDGLWSEHDSCLWHTCRIVAATVDGSLSQIPPQPTSLTPRFDPALEVMLVNGTFSLNTWGSAGGGVERSTGFFVATGRAGLTVTAGHMGAQAMSNARRKRQAAADETPRWMQTQWGSLHVSTHGFYMNAAGGLFPWDWPAIDEGRMVGPGLLEFQGESDAGPVRLQLASYWAELCFALWALARHPRHPQFVAGGWLPPNWVTWAAEQGYRPATVVPAVEGS
jgi:hypothetical protein